MISNTDIATWGRHRSLKAKGLLIAAIMLSAAVCACVIAVPEESEAGGEKNLHLIPGWVHGFISSGDVDVPGTARMTIEVEGSNPYGLTPDKKSFTLELNDKLRFSQPFKMQYTKPNDVPDGHVDRVKITVTDSNNHPFEYTDNYCAIVPKWTVDEPDNYATVEDGGIAHLSFNARSVVSSLASDKHTAEYRIIGAGYTEKVTISSKGINLPKNMPEGTNTYRIQLHMSGPGSGGDVQKDYESPEFNVTVGHRPTFSMDPVYDVIAGESIRIPLKSDSPVPGTWVVTKGDVNVAALDDAGDGQVLMIQNATKDADAGTYSVVFSIEGDIKSDKKEFVLDVYTKTDAGTVDITGADGSIIYVGETNNRTSAKVEPASGHRFEAMGPGGDCSGRFIIGDDGRIFVNGPLPDDTYALRFYDASSKEVQELVAGFRTVGPPTIDGVEHVEGGA